MEGGIFTEICTNGIFKPPHTLGLGRLVLPHSHTKSIKEVTFSRFLKSFQGTKVGVPPKKYQFLLQSFVNSLN